MFLLNDNGQNPDLHLRMWYLRPSESKALVLPKHVLVQDGHRAYEDNSKDDDSSSDVDIYDDSDDSDDSDESNIEIADSEEDEESDEDGGMTDFTDSEEGGQSEEDEDMEEYEVFVKPRAV